MLSVPKDIAWLLAQRRVFVLFIASLFLLAAAMHPREFWCVFFRVFSPFPASALDYTAQESAV
jgi:hypothetical protein